MAKKILVPLAEGFEETEATTIIDILRRAKIDVVTSSLKGEDLVKGAHNINIKADETLEKSKYDYFDGIVLAGGIVGMKNLKEDKRIISIIQSMYSNDLLVAAICASPVVLGEAGVLKGKFTCYPGLESEVKGGEYVNEDIVVRNGNVITSRGPATALFFALEIVKYLNGENEKLKEELLIPAITNKK